MPSTGTAAGSFDLGTLTSGERGTAGKRWESGGGGRGIVLDGAALTWRGGGVPCRRGFDDVTTIALETVIGEDVHARCDIRFNDGEALEVYVSDATQSEVLDYRAFVYCLFDQIGPERRSRIRFLHGYRQSTRIMSAVGAVTGLVVFGGILVYSVARLALYREAGWWLTVPVLLLGLVSCAYWLRLALRNGQRPFDPGMIPDSALPSAPPERRWRAV